MSGHSLGNYRDLEYVFGAYLNQDYVLFGPTLEDAVSAFCKDEPAKHVAAARADIARFLEENADDPDGALDALDPGRAQPPNLPARDYLLWLDRLLADAAAPARDHAAE